MKESKISFKKSYIIYEMKNIQGVNMSNKITWELRAEDISQILSTNKKTFNYIKGKLSRFYLQVNKEGIDLFFKDQSGIIKYSLPVTYINAPVAAKTFSIDYTKFLNSLLRFQIEGALLSLTDTSLIIVDINVAAISVKLSATVSSESLNEILEAKERDIPKLIEYSHGDELNDIFHLTSKLMNNGNPNNCLAIIDGDVATYADRSLIYKEKCKTDFLDAMVSIHSYLIGFIINTQHHLEAKYYFDFINNALFFKSKDVQAYLLSEKPDVSIPSDKDLEDIRPDIADKDTNLFEIPIIELINSLDFFEGFFERDVWKPITFSFKKNEQKLCYESPLTSVEKPFENMLFTIKHETEFTLMSTPLQSVLSSILDKNPEAMISIKEKPNMPGVSVTVKDSNFELILAKLNF